MIICERPPNSEYCSSDFCRAMAIFELAMFEKRPQPRLAVTPTLRRQSLSAVHWQDMIDASHRCRML